ncbi:MAG: hypothetical protein Q4G59_12385 [Planctomycetia bacterium]|nr:hypothetical protein [Planctomycetia bacterium]
MAEEHDDKKQNKKRSPLKRPSRRSALKQIMGLPVLGGLSAGFCCGSGLMLEEAHLLAVEEAKKTAASSPAGAQAAVDGTTGATRLAWETEQLTTLKKQVPQGKIKDLQISRLVLGGNLIGGWAHSRDLIYVSELIKRYHTKEKVFQTFRMAEKCGINTFMGNPVMYPMMSDYYTEGGGKIQFISDCGGRRSVKENMLEAIDHGCDACYVHGGQADRLVAEEKYDEIAQAFEAVRKNGVPVGLGAHFLETCLGVVKHGIVPDFWMKTYHTNNHYSALYGEGGTFVSKEFGKVVRTKGSYCPDAPAVRQFMENRPEPWIAFKVLAAGAIHPKQGFKHAFEGGADFICVGIYDFQMIDDANLCNDILDGKLNRTRPWING